MKSKHLILLGIFLILKEHAAAQSFQWAKRAGLWAFDLGYGIGTDNAGNVYIAGKYEMNAYFGGTYVSCAGNHDIYVAKYGPAGDFKWVRTAGGKGGDYAHAMAVDGDGNVYVTGEMEMTVKFGTVSLTGNGSNDVFVAKYNTNGDLQWAKKLGGSSKSDRGLGISVSNGNVYVTGHFRETANFAGTYLSSSGGMDIYVAKYTSGGVFQWVKKAGGSGDDEGYAIANDAAGDIYVTGYFSGTANFSGVSQTTRGSKDIFIARYSPSGSLIWVKKAGGSAADYGMGIKVNGSGTIFLTGGFRVSSTFGTITMNAQGGDADIFVASYNSSGNPNWVKKAGGRINDYGRAIAIDANSNCYITGNYGLSATFGATTISGADSTEVYFASYDASGNLRWVLKAGGSPDESDPGRFVEMGLSIATDPSKNVVASGTYRSNSTFGSTTLTKWDHTDVFITKIVQPSGARQQDTIKAHIFPSGPVSFCRSKGENLTLEALSDSGYTYQWKKDGLLIPGAVNPTYDVTASGEYQVRIIYGGQFAWSEVISVVTNKCEGENTVASDSLLATDEQSDLLLNNDSMSVQVYPNPNTGLFTIMINMPSIKQEKVKVRIVNLLGQQVFDKEYIPTSEYIKETVELDKSLSPGVYTLQVTIGTKVETANIVLSK